MIRMGSASAGARSRPLGRAAASSFVLVALLAAAGCGGDDGLSKQELVERADAICADANEKEQALGMGAPGWHYGPNFGKESVLSGVADIGRGAVEQLRALAPPAEDRETMEAVLSAMERSVAALEAQLASVRAGDRGDEAENVKEYENAYGDLASSAASMGLTQCQGVSV